MTQQANNEPGTTLFPHYDRFYDMLSTEVSGLTDEQLDFESDKWGWSEWSIRRNASHVASAGFRWLLGRWADQNLAQGLALPPDVDSIVNSNARWLDDDKYHSIDSIMRKLKEGLELSQAVLARETAGSMRAKELAWGNTGQAKQMDQAHSSGRREDPTDPEKAWITLEYTFRHIWFEQITHLYNIQRLKRAQGLTATVELPNEGYWTVPNWDRSEP